MLLKGVTKFIHYKRDILKPEKIEEIEKEKDAFRQLLKSGNKEAIRERAKDLQKTCERSLPMPTYPGVRENVEVFFVAIVIALGIRAYFLQPFKIPTGSMQPTLNGIIAHDYGRGKDAEWEEVKPNVVSKVWGLFWNGRNYIDVTAKEDFIPVGAYQKNPFKFFSFTYIERTTPQGQKMKPLKMWVPLDKALNPVALGGLALGEGLGMSPGESSDYVKRAQQFSRATPKVEFRSSDRRLVKAGSLLARGYVDTGDQVLVNKFSYHFRQPKRGEVFVFTTRGISLIENQSPNGQSQHYIKRLCGLPGDQFEVKDPDLFIDGERATEMGIMKVMDQVDGRHGYVQFPRDRRFNTGTLGEGEYLALGDNSRQSWDSRGWGPVPSTSNLVGPALFVYWPFGQHFGLIR